MLRLEKIKEEIKNKRCAIDQDYSLVKKLTETVETSLVSSKDVKIMKFELAKKIKEIKYFSRILFSNI